MLLKIPNFGQNEGGNERVRERSVWFEGGGTELMSTIPKSQHHLQSTSQRFPFQVIIFPLV